MEKKTEEEEFKKLWEDNIGTLAYDLEEAFLEVFRKRSVELQKPAFYLGSIAMAAGHILQVTETDVQSLQAAPFRRGKFILYHTFYHGHHFA